MPLPYPVPHLIAIRCSSSDNAIEQVAQALPAERPPSPTDTVLDTAIITASEVQGSGMVAVIDKLRRR